MDILGDNKIYKWETGKKIQNNKDSKDYAALPWKAILNNELSLKIFTAYLNEMLEKVDLSVFLALRVA